MGGLGLGSWGLSRTGLNAMGAVESKPERSVILLLLVGGPSQLETWDPKPDAPAEYRGMAVPEVLMSGDHGAVARWRREQANARSQLGSNQKDEKS